MCKGKYWWQVGVGKQPWFYCDIKQEKVEAVEAKYVLDPNVSMDKISANNIPPKKVKDQLRKRENQKALKLSAESHSYICDQLKLCSQMDYDPNQIYFGDEEDSVYNSDDEDGECNYDNDDDNDNGTNDSNDDKDNDDSSVHNSSDDNINNNNNGSVYTSSGNGSQSSVDDENSSSDDNVDE